MVEKAVQLTPTVLLYSPRPQGEVDYQMALEAAGFRVLRSATVAGCAAHLDAGIELVVLDDPPWELARGLVALLDVTPLPTPRIWVSSSSAAPSRAGKLGVDALLLDPRDIDAVVEQVRRTLLSWLPATEQVPMRRPGSLRAETSRELHPRPDRFDDESSDSWP